MRALISLLTLSVLATSGCSAVLYYGFPETTTREVERTSRVVVRSHPRGATIARADGTVLGAAPLAAEVDYKVRRTTSRNSTRRAALGCAIDTAALVGGIVASVESDSALADAAFYGSLGLFAGCFALVYVKTLNAVLMEPYYRSTQAPLLLTSPVRRGDEVIAGELELEARWSDGSRARAAARAPGQDQILIRQPPAQSFDEALMRYDESRGRPLGTEGLYRRGRAYLALARNGGGRAAASRAIADLERALAGGELAAERAREVRRMLGELRALEERRP